MNHKVHDKILLPFPDDDDIWDDDGDENNIIDDPCPKQYGYDLLIELRGHTQDD